MRLPSRDTALDAGLAMLAAGVHLAMSAVVDRFPPALDLSLLFVLVPAVGAAIASVVLLVDGDRRPLGIACLYTWLMALFTLPAYLLGLAWVPGAALLTLAYARPRLSSGRPVAG